MDFLIKFCNLKKFFKNSKFLSILPYFLLVYRKKIQGVSGEMSLFYFAITFFWKMILNFRLLENNELICPFYACFFVFENLDFSFVRARPIEHLSIIKGELKNGRMVCVEYNGTPVSS